MRQHPAGRWTMAVLAGALALGVARPVGAQSMELWFYDRAASGFTVLNASGQPLRTIPFAWTQGSEPQFMVMPDRATLYFVTGTTGWDSAIWKADLTTGQATFLFNAPWSYLIAFDPNDRTRIFYTLADGAIWRYDTTSATSTKWQDSDQLIAQFGFDTFRLELAFAENGTAVVRAGYGGAGGDAVFLARVCGTDATHHLCDLAVLSNPGGGSTSWDNVASHASIDPSGRFAFFQTQTGLTTHRFWRRDLTTGVEALVWSSSVGSPTTTRDDVVFTAAAEDGPNRAIYACNITSLDCRTVFVGGPTLDYFRVVDVPDPAATETRLTSARRPAFSFDGRYTAFESLVAIVPEDTNGVGDVYVHDKVADTIRRVSISSSGTQAVGGESTHAAISANGRYVAFQSRAVNLVPGDTNGLTDVFLHDRDVDADGVLDEPGQRATIRVSLSSAGLQASDGGSARPALSGNGRWIAFESTASTLADGDANGTADVFVHDHLLRETRRVSLTSSGAEATGGASSAPVMSLDGRYVAFESSATSLVADDTNGTRDVFFHDRDVDADGLMDEPGSTATTRVSVATGGGQALGGASGDASMTEQGRWVVFASDATNLVPNDGNGATDVFLHDRGTGTTVRATQRPDGSSWPSDSWTPRISANGAALVFLTADANALPPAAGMGEIQAAVPVGKATTGRIPLPTAPVPPAAAIDPPQPAATAEDPAVSGDGSHRGSTITPMSGSGSIEPSLQVEGPAGLPASEAAPYVTTLWPAQGPPAGGNVVDVDGAHFPNPAAVLWGGVPLDPGAIQRLSAGRLRIVVPGQSGVPVVEVWVQGSGQVSNALPYRYLSALSTPRITGMTPAQGQVGGGERVTISGGGFSAPAVRFGPYAAAIESATPTTVVVTVPPAASSGPVPVVVSNGDGAVATSDDPYTYGIGAPASAPSIAQLQPSSGPMTGGTLVTIRGAQFIAGAIVTIGGAQASDVQVLSSTEILAVTPAGVEGPATVNVSTGTSQAVSSFQYLPAQSPVLVCSGSDADMDGVADDWEDQFGLSSADAADASSDADGDGRTNAQECQAGTHPRGLYTRFLAEGATGAFFDTRIALTNPGTTPARALLRFLTQRHDTARWFVTVPPLARRTIDLGQIAGLQAADVSSIVESDVELVVDRTMRWDRATRAGAHAESSLATPALRWYLAEGATHGTFDLFYLIQNPSSTQAATVRIQFLRPSGTPLERSYTVAAGSRFTLSVDTIPELAATDVSAVIESTNGVPLIVERAMYSSAAGTFAAGHSSAGVTSPSTRWFFAEGATGTFFDLFLLLANPDSAAATIEATYLLPSGSTVTKTYTIAPTSRRTVYVAAEDPRLADTAVSVTIASNNGVPIIAERAMWWPHGQPWYEAHNSAGSTVTGTRWAVGDGEEGSPDGSQTYLLVANTSGVAAALRVTVLLESGAPLTRDYVVAANSRFNVPVGSDFALAPGTRFGAIVESLGANPAQIVVERAMYWNANGTTWAAGSNLLATRLR